MLTTGVDIVTISRVQRALERHGERFLNRVYTPSEIAWCRGRVPELAVRFAAKEAVSKALGTGMRLMSQDGIDFHDVEITVDELGKPLLALCGRAEERAGELGLTEWALSLSHERDVAVAFVVAQ
jgi:holo-[acyl-carrier protein] synthase